MKSVVIDPTALLRGPVKPGQKDAKIKQVAQQFESILLKEITKHAVPKAGIGGEESLASKTWSDMLAHQLADSVASAGTTGLSKILAERLGSIGHVGHSSHRSHGSSQHNGKHHDAAITFLRIIILPRHRGRGAGHMPRRAGQSARRHSDLARPTGVGHPQLRQCRVLRRRLLRQGH